jgi:hypothetical protein
MFNNRIELWEVGFTCGKIELWEVAFHEGGQYYKVITDNYSSFDYDNEIPEWHDMNDISNELIRDIEYIQSIIMQGGGK